MQFLTVTQQVYYTDLFSLWLIEFFDYEKKMIGKRVDELILEICKDTQANPESAALSIGRGKFINFSSLTATPVFKVYPHDSEELKEQVSSIARDFNRLDDNYVTLSSCFSSLISSVSTLEELRYLTPSNLYQSLNFSEKSYYEIPEWRIECLDNLKKDYLAMFNLLDDCLVKSKIVRGV